MPFDDDVVRATTMMGYRLVTHVIPICVIIKCFWTSQNDDPFSALSAEVQTFIRC